MARKKDKKEAEKPVVETIDSRVIDAERLDEDLENWAEDQTSEAYAEAMKLYPKIQKCYENKQLQSDWVEGIEQADDYRVTSHQRGFAIDGRANL